MNEMYQIDIKAADCPIRCFSELQDSSTNISNSWQRISLGSRIMMSPHFINSPLKVGDKPVNFPFLKCIRVFYEPRKWYQKIFFLRKRKIIGYLLERIE